MKLLNTFIIFLSILAFTGCESNVFNGYVSKGKAEMAIQELREEHQKSMTKQITFISEKKDEVIEGKSNQMQAAANSLYAADNAFTFYEMPDRLDLIINTRVKEGFAAIQMAPTAEFIKEENGRLKRELDETATSLSDLRKTHQDKVTENSLLVEATKVYQNELMLLAERRDEMRDEFITEREALQNNLNQANDKIISFERERADSREAIIERNKKITWVCGIISLLCLAAAIWSPLFKDKFAMLSGVSGAIALGIWYIEPWHVAIFAGVCILSLVGWLLYKYNISRKTSVALVNKIQDDKDKDPEKFKSVDAPALQEWSTKVKVKRDGSIHKVPDKQITKEINEILVEGNRK